MSNKNKTQSQTKSSASTKDTKKGDEQPKQDGKLNLLDGNQQPQGEQTKEEKEVKPKALKPAYDRFLRNGVRTTTPSDISRERPILKGKRTTFFYQALLTFSCLGFYSKHSKENLANLKDWLNTELKLDDQSKFVGFSSFHGKWELVRTYDKMTFTFEKEITKESFVESAKTHIKANTK